MNQKKLKFYQMKRIQVFTKLELCLIKNSYLLHPIAMKIMMRLKKGFDGRLQELTREVGENHPQTTKHHLQKLFDNGLLKRKGNKMFLSKEGEKKYQKYLKKLIK